MILEFISTLCENSDNVIRTNRKLFDIGYAEDVRLSEDPIKLHVFLHSMNDSVCMFGMDFAPTKCKMVQQD